MPASSQRSQLMRELRDIDQQLARDAASARSRTIAALRAAARITRSDAPSSRKASNRASGLAIRFPKKPSSSYSRAGIRYQQSATRMPDGTLKSSFHLRLTKCNSAAIASAHQSYIDRPQASVFDHGNISDDPDERIQFWNNLDRCAQHYNGSIILPPDFDPAVRKAIAQTLHKLDPPLPKPSALAIAAWQRHGTFTLRLPDLSRPVFDKISATLHSAWTDNIDPAHTQPKDKPDKLPGDIKTFPPRSSIIQRRIVLELPHDVSQSAREQILRNWCAANLDPHATTYHAVIHKPPPGNDGRNWHAHIAIFQFDIPRDEHNRVDTNAITDTLPVNRLGAILARNAPNLPLPERAKLATDTLLKMRSTFATIANEQLTNAASERRYDPRSYANQGLDIVPGTHRGTAATGMHKRRIPTRWNNHSALWRNAANAAASLFPPDQRDEILDAIENRMSLQSASPLAEKFREFLHRDNQQLKPILQAIDTAIDSSLQDDRIEHLAGLPTWRRQWGALHTHAPPSPAHAARDAFILADTNPDIRTCATDRKSPHEKDAIAILRNADLYSELLASWKPSIDSYITSRPLPGTPSSDSPVELQPHHHMALSISRAAEESGLNDISLIADPDTVRSIEHSFKQAHALIAQQQRLETKQQRNDQRHEKARQKLLKEWKEACSRTDPANFVLRNADQIDQLLPLEAAAAMRRAAAGDILRPDQPASVRTLRRRLRSIPADSARNHSLANVSQTVLDNLLAHSPRDWQDHHQRMVRLRAREREWRRLAPKLADMSDIQFLAIPPATFDHARNHDPAGFRRATNRTANLIAAIEQDFDDHLDLPPEHAAWRLTTKYLPHLESLQARAPDLAGKLLAHKQIAHTADRLLLEHAKTPDPHEIPNDPDRVARLRNLDPPLAASLLARYDPTQVLQHITRAAPSPSTPRLPAP